MLRALYARQMGESRKNVYTLRNRSPLFVTYRSYRSRNLGAKRSSGLQYAANTVPDCLGETCHNPVVCGVFTVERAVIDERTS